MDWSPDYFGKRIMVFGCGNILLGDDGFGPAVIEHLEKNHTIPEHACVVDAGTSIRDILFDLILTPTKPKKIIIVDAVDHSNQGRQPGEVFEISLEQVPPEKSVDFSLHLAPTSNLLKELRDYCLIQVHIIACQVTSFSSTVKTGLSEPVQQAVSQTSRLIVDKYLPR